MVFITSTTVLVIAGVMEADPHGLGTHQQLGLPPCGLLVFTGVPCVTCGMTTAFTNAAHGHLLTAWVSQPAGTILAVITAAGSLISATATVMGASLGPIGRFLWRPSVVLAGSVVLLASWAYKILSYGGGL